MAAVGALSPRCYGAPPATAYVAVLTPRGGYVRPLSPPVLRRPLSPDRVLALVPDLSAKAQPSPRGALGWFDRQLGHLEQRQEKYSERLDALLVLRDRLGHSPSRIPTPRVSPRGADRVARHSPRGRQGRAASPRDAALARQGHVADDVARQLAEAKRQRAAAERKFDELRCAHQVLEEEVRGQAGELAYLGQPRNRSVEAARAVRPQQLAEDEDVSAPASLFPASPPLASPAVAVDIAAAVEARARAVVRDSNAMRSRIAELEQELAASRNSSAIALGMRNNRVPPSPRYFGESRNAEHRSFDGRWITGGDSLVNIAVDAHGRCIAAGCVFSVIDPRRCIWTVAGVTLEGDLSMDGRSIEWSNGDLWCRAAPVIPAESLTLSSPRTTPIGDEQFRRLATQHEGRERKLAEAKARLQGLETGLAGLQPIGACVSTDRPSSMAGVVSPRSSTFTPLSTSLVNAGADSYAVFPGPGSVCNRATLPPSPRASPSTPRSSVFSYPKAQAESSPLVGQRHSRKQSALSGCGALTPRSRALGDSCVDPSVLHSGRRPSLNQAVPPQSIALTPRSSALAGLVDATANEATAIEQRPSTTWKRASQAPAEAEPQISVRISNLVTYAVPPDQGRASSLTGRRSSRERLSTPITFSTEVRKAEVAANKRSSVEFSDVVAETLPPESVRLSSLVGRRSSRDRLPTPVPDEGVLEDAEFAAAGRRQSVQVSDVVSKAPPAESIVDTWPGKEVGHRPSRGRIPTPPAALTGTILSPRENSPRLSGPMLDELPSVPDDDPDLYAALCELGLADMPDVPEQRLSFSAGHSEPTDGRRSTLAFDSTCEVIPPDGNAALGGAVTGRRSSRDRLPTPRFSTDGVFEDVSPISSAPTQRSCEKQQSEYFGIWDGHSTPTSHDFRSERDSVSSRLSFSAAPPDMTEVTVTHGTQRRSSRDRISTPFFVEAGAGPSPPRHEGAAPSPPGGGDSAAGCVAKAEKIRGSRAGSSTFPLLPEPRKSPVTKDSIRQAIAERLPILQDAAGLREARRLVREELGGPKAILEELAEAGFVDGITKRLATGLQSPNTFVRVASGEVLQPGMEHEQSALGVYADRFLVCRNGDDDERWNAEAAEDGSWSFANSEWESTTSMACRYRILTRRNLDWQWFNIITFGSDGDQHQPSTAGLRAAVAEVESLQAAALAYAAAAGWSDRLGLYFHVYGHASVNALQLHVLDLTPGGVGPSFKSLAYKNCPLDAALQVLREEFTSRSSPLEYATPVQEAFAVLDITGFERWRLSIPGDIAHVKGFGRGMSSCYNEAALSELAHFSVLAWDGEAPDDTGFTAVLVAFLRERPGRKAVAFCKSDGVVSFQSNWHPYLEQFRGRIVVVAVSMERDVALLGLEAEFSRVSSFPQWAQEFFLLGRVAMRATSSKQVIALGGDDIAGREAAASFADGVKWTVYALSRGSKEQFPSLMDWAAKQDTPHLTLVRGRDPHELESFTEESTPSVLVNGMREKVSSKEGHPSSVSSCSTDSELYKL